MQWRKSLGSNLFKIEIVSVETLNANATPIIVDMKRFSKHHLPHMSKTCIRAARCCKEKTDVGVNQLNNRSI